MKKTLLCFLFLLFTSIFYAQVTSITTCGDAPLNLTNLKADFIGNLNPDETSVSYFLSLDDALNNTNVIANPTTYIGVAGISKIYGRIDNNGTITTNYFNLTVFKPLTVTASNLPILCKGDRTSLTVNVSGEYSSYQYSINGGPFTSNNYYNNLPAGVYTIKVKSPDNVCPDVTINHTITEPNALLATAAIVNQNTIITTAVGGTAPYAYSLNGLTFQNNNVFPNVNPGSYTISVRDAVGCVTFVPMNVLPRLDAAVAIVKELDCTNNSGAVINIIGVGGQAPYVYSIDNGYTYQQFNFFNNVNAGTYFVIVKDALNSVSNPYRLVINPPAPITGTALVTNATSCTSALITVQATGGQAPYYYSIDNGATYTNSNIFNNLSAGNYIIFIKDSKDCVSAPLFNMVQPPLPPLMVTAAITPILCSGEKATLTAMATGGQAPYQYSLNNDIYSSNNVFANLNAGNPIIKVKDATGCISALPYTITEPNAVTGVISIEDQTISVIDVTGGTGTYQYALDNAAFQSSNIFTNVNPGLHTVRLKDSNNCEHSGFSAEIASPITAIVSITKELDCTSGAEIMLTATGGFAPYIYSINGGKSFQPSNIFTNLVAGNYSIIVKDPYNRVYTQSITINPLPPIYPDTIIDGTTITINGMAGTAPYLYAVDNGPLQTNNVFTNLSDGVHYITIKDSKGCISNGFNVYIEGLNNLIAVAQLTKEIDCYSNGTITMSATGGTAPYSYSIDGTVTFQSSTIFTNVAAGTYAIIAKDANNLIVASNNVTVPPLSYPTITASKIDVSCSQANSGSINIQAQGGKAPYVYSINNDSFVPTNIFTNLAAGIYDVAVKDAKGCLSSFFINIEEPTPIAITTSITNSTSCNNGKITVNATGGQIPLYYSINGGVTYSQNNIFSDLPAGNYTVLVKDSKGCVSSELFNTVATPPAVLTGTVAITNPTDCQGIATIKATASGGTSPYQYSINNGPYSSVNLFNQFIGSHIINIKDANGCVYSQPITVASPAPISLIPLVVNSRCSNSSDGSITVITNGGLAPYTYTLNNVYQDSNVFMNLSPGNYVVTVRDSKGCINTVPAVITAPEPLNINVTTTNTSCSYATDGIINISTTGGTAPYTYSINDNIYSANNSFNNLIAGYHDLLIKDAQGCIVSYRARILKPDPLAMAVDVSPVFFNDGTIGGKITINSSGGVAPYTYSIKNNSSGVLQVDNKTSTVYSGIPAGSYTITTKDANGCVVEKNDLTIVSPPQMAITAKSTGISCNNNTSEITVTVSGGTPPYLYAFDDITFTANNTFTVLEAGSYTIAVQDALGIIKRIDHIVKPFVPVTMTTNFANGNVGDQLTVSASGGTAPYRYNVINSATGSILYENTTSTVYNELPAGSYFIIAKDANNCESARKDVEIAPLSPLVITATNPPVSCLNSTTLTINVSGGTPPYLYNINEGVPYTTSNIFEGVESDIYKINVTDAAGNKSWIMHTVAPNVWLSITWTKENATCFGNADGSVTTAASGGVPPYRYAIMNKMDTVTVPNYGSLNVFPSLVAGDYLVLVKDAGGCIRSSSVTISQSSLLSVTNTGTRSTTAYSNDGTITMIASGGTAPYTYSLKTESGIVIVASQTSNIFKNLAIGPYSAMVTDAKGCTKSIDRMLIASATLFGTLTTTPITCTALGTININAAGGEYPHQYSFDNGVTYGSSNIAANVAAGVYQIKVKDAIGTILSLSATIAPLNSFVATLTLNSVINCNGGNDAVIKVTASGGKTPYSYSLNGGPYQSSNTFTNLSAGNYIIDTKDSNNCSSTMMLNVSEPALLTSTAEVKDNTITVTATGGTAPYRYSLVNSSGATVILAQTSKIFENVPAGTYTVRIADSRNCYFSQDGIVVIEPASLIATYTTTQATCITGGTITINATGGTSPYQYSVDNGVTYRSTNVFPNLNPGNYILKIKDAQNATTSIPVFLETPVPIMASAVITETINCVNNAVINVEVSGGKAPYQYSINGNVYQYSNIFANVSAGSYAVTVKDANDCIAITNNISIAPVVPLVLTSNITQTTSPSSNDGKITLNTIGGIAPYTYSLKNQSGITLAPFQTANVFNNLANGTYIVEVRDSKGCISLKTEVITSSAPALVAVYTTTQATCNTGGTITIIATGGTGPYQYSLDNGITYSSSNTFVDLLPGTYNIKVRDAQNANTSIMAVIDPISTPVITSTAVNIYCKGENNTGSITVTAIGGKSPYIYSVNGSPFQTNNTFSNLSAGMYIITVKDANNCTATLTNTISEPATPLTATIAVNNQTVTINAQGGTGTIVYAISTNFAEFSTNNTFPNLAPGVYTVLAQDQNGCFITFDVSINPPAPITEEGKNEIVYEYKPGQTLGDIVIEGENIKWYSSQNSPTSKTAETPLPLTTVLVNGVTYYASQTVNGIESKDRLAVTAKLNGSLSTPDFDLAGFKFYPNPVKNILTVNNTSVIDEVQIISISGESVLLKKINNTHSEIDLSNLSTGVYILKVKADGKQKATKFIKE